jgi:hypothetical protein
MFSQCEDNPRHIKLDHLLHVDVWLHTDFHVLVPEGFVSDGASIPAMFWVIVGPPLGSNHLIASIVHDYLCESATDYSERLLADAVFFKLLRDYGVPAWKRSVMYVAVRLMGRWTWRRSNA